MEKNNDLGSDKHKRPIFLEKHAATGWNYIILKSSQMQCFFARQVYRAEPASSK
jgi:hypothetical protein